MMMVVTVCPSRPFGLKILLDLREILLGAADFTRLQILRELLKLLRDRIDTLSCS